MGANSDPHCAILVDGWFDGEQRHPGPTTLKVLDRRLAGVMPGDHRSELAALGWPLERGAFLLPGLVDAHAHLFLNGTPTDAGPRAAHLKRPLDELVDAARANARHALQCESRACATPRTRTALTTGSAKRPRVSGSGLAQVRSAELGVKRPKRYGALMATDVATPRASSRFLIAPLPFAIQQNTRHRSRQTWLSLVRFRQPICSTFPHAR